MGRPLGQHFLRNPEISRRIVEALDLRSGDTVVEVGAGRGALTRTLIESCKLKVDKLRITAIERDEKLAADLGLRIKDQGFEIITGDALKILPEVTQKFNGGYKLVGNIPYYITGKLLRVIGELEHKPEVTILMIQKEVAERVSAKSPRFNLLAASVQAWAEVEVLFQVSRREFKPMPKVESAVVRLRLKTQDLRLRDEYYRLMKIIFKQPRKTILNNLSAGFDLPKEKLQRVLRDAGINPSDRPQTLSVELITKLARMLYNG
ncbi:MAG: 16S rRNA (adenine(1518)-N(6)/adenine(1519)-N(6))-dimethyltransferase RsmA [bacterium]|nr:16S rRNA (adenine(1518)-N(6)/adenine(1519)-N(6))-dimethyltransferase RsmA [bacterium]